MRTRSEVADEAQSAGAARRASRRRGEQLEHAILAAAMAELADVGYTSITIERIAVRAGTSKSVLYRRWPNRAELIVAALRSSIPSSREVPDAGNLRDDALAILRLATRRIAEEIGAETIYGLMSDVAADPGLRDRLRFGDLIALRTEIMQTVIDRAVARGEISAARLPSRIIGLPVDLLRHDILLLGNVDDATLVDVVDNVYLPLLRAAAPPPAASRS